MLPLLPLPRLPLRSRLPRNGMKSADEHPSSVPPEEEPEILSEGMLTELQGIVAELKSSAGVNLAPDSSTSDARRVFLSVLARGRPDLPCRGPEWR